MQGEAFYDTGFGDWSRERYQAGVEIQLTRQWRLEPYFRWQENRHPSRTQENGVGLVLKYFH